MKIVVNYPPNIEEIKKHFKPNSSTVFTYGKVLYSPHQSYLEDDLLVHEETHSIQQGDDPDGWWNKYMTDPKFRLDQELKAYHNQYKFFIQKHSESQINQFVLDKARDLCSPIYNLGTITLEEAIKKIKGNESVVTKP